MPIIFATNPINSAVTNANGFGIIQPPSGTSPTATTPNATLTLTSTDSSLTITGNSGTNTVNFAVNGTSVGGFTAGSVIFAGASGTLSQDNTNFFWDRTNKRLGIGGHSSVACLSVMGASTTDITCQLLIAGSQTANVLEVKDNQLAVVRAFIDFGGNIGCQRQITCNHFLVAGNGSDTNINGNIGIINCVSGDQTGMGAFATGQKGIYFFVQVSGNLYSIDAVNSVAGTPLPISIGLDVNNIYINGFGGRTIVGVAVAGTISAQFQSVTRDAALPAIIAKAAASQTADIFDVQDSSGNNLVVVDKSGNVGINQASPGSSLEVKGIIASNAGTGTTLAKHGGTVSQNTTQLGNTANTETNLYSYSVAANSLAVNGDRVFFEYGGTFATSINTDKQIKVKFGSTTALDTGALAITTAANWRIRGYVIRTGAATQKAFVEITTSSSVLVDTVSFTSPGETLSGAVTLVITGKGTGASDVVFEAGFIRWESAP